MSQYGTSEDYETGYNDGADETAGIYSQVVAAARALLERWPTNKNLSEQIQALESAVKALPQEGRHFLETGRDDEDEDDDEGGQDRESYSDDQDRESYSA